MDTKPGAAGAHLAGAHRAGAPAVVIGASAGGVEALKQLVGALPHGFPSPIFIVLHVGDVSYMPEILARAGSLPVVRPRSGERIVPGSIYVAPPERHMLVHDDHILLRRGPREILARPAIDPLFRSAACSFGARTIGVILTGSLGDGASGLRAIKRCGGIAIVQDPADAIVPDMPRNALAHVEVDHCVALAELGGLLAMLVAEPPREMIAIPEEICLEAAVAAQEHVNMQTEEKLGSLSPFVCPECSGPLWEIEDGKILRYRCHAGHALSAEAMLSAQATEAENMIERLLRVHQQRAALARRIATRDLAEGRHDSAGRMQEKAREYERDAEMVGHLLDDRDVRAGDDPAPDQRT
ncbi:MAG TPA: chemotaxis protein CheB [Saliniramus sp.]|nr:chemotaxis protein CheB [Saliniramus sp.]